MMTTSPLLPLKSLLERKHGTLRFGQALRLLGRWNHALQLEVLDLLEQAQTVEHLLLALRQAVQACALASAKTPFIIVPDEADLRGLVEDVETYSVRLVASILQILSVVRYSSTSEAEAEQAATIQEATQDASEDEPPDTPHEDNGAKSDEQ